MKCFLKSFLILTLFSSVPLSGWAQETHLEQLQKLSIQCVRDVLTSLDKFELEADDRSPYIRSAITNYSMAEGKDVFSPDSLQGVPALPRFQYQITDIGIELTTSSKNSVQRKTRLAMHYMLTGPEGQVVADNDCDRNQVDEVNLDALDELNDARYTETQAYFERRSWIERSLTPAVIMGAAVIGTYLFFNLRSKRSSDG